MRPVQKPPRRPTASAPRSSDGAAPALTAPQLRSSHRLLAAGDRIQNGSQSQSCKGTRRDDTDGDPETIGTQASKHRCRPQEQEARYGISNWQGPVSRHSEHNWLGICNRSAGPRPVGRSWQKGTRRLARNAIRTALSKPGRTEGGRENCCPVWSGPRHRSADQSPFRGRTGLRR